MPTGLGDEYLEDADLESGLQAVSNVDTMRKEDSYAAMAMTQTLSRTAYQNTWLKSM